MAHPKRLSTIHRPPTPTAPRGAPGRQSGGPANDNEAEFFAPGPVRPPTKSQEFLRLSPSEERLAEELVEAFMAKVLGK